MSHVSVDDIRQFLTDRFEDPIIATGYAGKSLPDDLDLLAAGIIDSLGILELVAALEERFGIAIDFDDLDPDDLTVIGPLCTFVAAKVNARP